MQHHLSVARRSRKASASAQMSMHLLGTLSGAQGNIHEPPLHCKAKGFCGGKYVLWPQICVLMPHCSASQSMLSWLLLEHVGSSFPAQSLYEDPKKILLS